MRSNSGSLENIIAIVERCVTKGEGIDGRLMAAFAQALIANEIKVGGPYKNSEGVMDGSLNARIAGIFVSLGTPLPNLARYTITTSAKDMITLENHFCDEKARELARSIIAGYPNVLRQQAMRQFEKICRIDKSGEISSLSRWFNGLLSSSEDTTELGAANALVWMSYSLYDDLLDGEQGAIEGLGLANATMRDAFTLFRRYSPGMSGITETVFTAMDAANAKELAARRFIVANGFATIAQLPKAHDYSLLADRSLAHILGPLLLAHKVNRDTVIIENALRDYLIARQFNDDLHDWADDTAHGHISPVVAWLIERTGVQPGVVPLEDLLNRMRMVFWQDGLDTLSMDAIRHCKRARRTLVHAGFGKGDESFYTHILNPIQTTLEQGRDRHKSDRDFNEAYRVS